MKNLDSNHKRQKFSSQRRRGRTANLSVIAVFIVLTMVFAVSVGIALAPHYNTGKGSLKTLSITQMD